MTNRLLLLLCAFPLGGCNCFVPVEECVGIRCSRLPDGGPRDGGRQDGGVQDRDGGADAGRNDGGTFEPDGGPACAGWDGGGLGACAAITGFVHRGNVCQGDCVLYPIATPGVYPTLGACVACGCDTAKLVARPLQPFGPEAYCDDVFVFTSLPRLLEEAFAGFDGGCVSIGAIDHRCQLLRHQTLGDAGYARACAATLVPYVKEVQCLVYL